VSDAQSLMSDFGFGDCDGLRIGRVLRWPSVRDMVRWVDLLGRDYDDVVVEAIQCFMKRGIVIKTVIKASNTDSVTR
jgi:hypothetical protein